MDDLGVMEDTGFDNQTVREAYDELLDYLTIPGREFSTGVFAFSEEGADHFADCRMLFNINITAFLISAIAVAVVLILAKKRLITLLSVR